MEAENTKKKFEFQRIQYDYKCCLGKLLTKQFIESEKFNPEIDFEQEYCCKFTTSGSAAFKEDEIIYHKDSEIDYFNEF